MPKNYAVRAVAALLIVSSAPVPATAAEPRAIKSATALGAGEGAVRISVRSQVQLGGTMHLWFVRQGGNAQNKADVLKFERKQGIPIAGTNTIDSRPRVFRVPAGGYRLLAHGVNCDGVPPENAVCMISIGGTPRFPQPTGRYSEPSPSFEVVPGGVTDAGEFVLEFPPGTVIDAPLSNREAMDRLMTTAIRWRPIAAAMPTAFAALPAGPSPQVPDIFRSNLRCEQKPPGSKGMMLYYPFDC